MSRYTLVIPSDADPWAQRFQADINRVLGQIENDRRIPRLAKADLPEDGSQTLAIVLDDVGGVVLAFFDGAAWRRATDRALVT